MRRIKRSVLPNETGLCMLLGLLLAGENEVRTKARTAVRMRENVGSVAVAVESDGFVGDADTGPRVAEPELAPVEV